MRVMQAVKRRSERGGGKPLLMYWARMDGKELSTWRDAQVTVDSSETRCCLSESLTAKLSSALYETSVNSKWVILNLQFSVAIYTPLVKKVRPNLLIRCS